MKGYLDAKELESYKKEDLQELAKQLGVDAEGTKKEIATRCAAVEVDIPDESELTEEDKRAAEEAAAEAAAKAEEEEAATELVKVKAQRRFLDKELNQITVYYCDEAAVGMKFVAGDVSGTVQGVTHIQTDEAAAAGEAGNDRTALTLSKAVKAGCKVIALERTDTVAGMTTDDIAALKGVLKQYE